MKKFRDYFEITESEAKVVVQAAVAICLVLLIGLLTGKIYIP